MIIDKRLQDFELNNSKWVSFPKTDNVIEFCQDFVLSSFKEIKIAISGLGFFEAYINGKKIDPYFYEPSFSDYAPRDQKEEPQIVDGPTKRIYFVIRNVASLCHEGKNSLVVLLGNGYFQNEDRLEEPFKADYGSKRLLFSIRCLETSGRVSFFHSGLNTLVRTTNIISGLYKGNHIDFKRNDNKYTTPLLLDNPASNYGLSSAPEDTLDKEIKPVSEKKFNDGVLYDFGINHSGGLHLLIKGNKGQKIIIKHAEVLYPDGTPNYETSRFEEYAHDGSNKLLKRIDQVSEYVLSGETDEIRPLFSWYCYRYVEIIGLGNAKVLEMTSWFIHANIPSNGSFKCENDILNEMEEKGRLTIQDNLHAGILSDCPHREKRPYTGDDSLVMESLMYQFDGEGFYSKWLNDIIASQRDDGFVPYTAPHLGGGGGLAWGLAIVKVPSLLFSFTGKLSYLKKAYKPILKWISFLENHQGKDCQIAGQNWLLGDWLTPDVCLFSVPFMNAICLHYSLLEASNIAHLLDDKKGERLLNEKLDDITSFVNSSFYDDIKKQYVSGIQGEDLYPLLFGIAPKGDRKTILKRIAKNYEDNGYHVDTGIVMTPLLFETLFNNGYEDLAIKILTETSYPSFAYMLNNETTFVEHWSKKWMDYKIGDRLIKGGGELSNCHPVFSSSNACLYKYVAGLDLSLLSEKRIMFHPLVMETIRSAKAEKVLNTGTTSISYYHDSNDSIVINIIVPSRYIGKANIPTKRTLLIDKKHNTSYQAVDGHFSFSLRSGSYNLISPK